MPVNDDDDISDNDPWGSDFDDDDDDFEGIINQESDKDIHDDEDADNDDSGSGYEEYEERRNTSSVFYSRNRQTSSPRRGTVSKCYCLFTIFIARRISLQTKSHKKIFGRKKLTLSGEGPGQILLKWCIFVH